MDSEASISRKTPWLIALAGFGVVGLAAYATHTPVPNPPQTGKVRLLSYNIQANAPSLEDTSQVILDADADIVCLQEVTPDAHRRLRRDLKGRYPAFLYRDSHGGYGGLAFYSKYALADDAFMKQIQGGCFPAWKITAETPAGPLQILQVHLRPLKGGGILVGQLTVGIAHQREIGVFFESIDTDLPAVVVGDFNEGSDGSAIRHVEKAGFSNVLSIFDKETATWHGRVLGIPLSARVDHVLASSDFTCAAASVRPGGNSDHRAVLAELIRH